MPSFRVKAIQTIQTPETSDDSKYWIFTASSDGYIKAWVVDVQQVVKCLIYLTFSWCKIQDKILVKSNHTTARGRDDAVVRNRTCVWQGPSSRHAECHSCLCPWVRRFTLITWTRRSCAYSSNWHDGTLRGVDSYWKESVRKRFKTVRKRRYTNTQ